MHGDSILSTIFLIFTGASLLATFALMTRQSLLVSYILLGVLLGPWCLKYVDDPTMIEHVSEVGIIFLLFLLGLHLQPQNLVFMIKKVTSVAFISSLVFLALGYGVSVSFGLSNTEGIIIGAAMMFSSTIIGLKLLPTTILHHKHTGEVMISVLLLQDLVAIIVLMALHGAASDSFQISDAALIILGLPALFLITYIVEHYLLVKLFVKFDRTQEYIFIVAIGWCLGIAKLATLFGLSEEIGAFIAGVVLAEGPISLFIAESLKPLRDFFLVLFFFSVGAKFDFGYVKQVAIPAGILATLLLIIKPVIFGKLLKYSGETKRISTEVGWRLGQASEFSLLVGTLAANSSLISTKAAYLIQATTILTFIASSYIVVLRYPTPIALTDNMRKD